MIDKDCIFGLNDLLVEGKQTVTTIWWSFDSESNDCNFSSQVPPDAEEKIFLIFSQNDVT